LSQPESPQPETRVGSKQRRRRPNFIIDTSGWVMAAAVFLAPLAVGTVHRPALVTLFVVVGAALIALFLGQLRAGDRMRVGASAILPAVFVVICVLQLVPLPPSLRNAIDPAGSELLANALAPIHAHPLSLDPPSTWRELGKAAAVLAVFLFAYHLGAGRRAPRRMIYTVAGAGIIALLLGLGHAAMGEKSIFGFFATGPKLPVVGPFINRNHTAEFLELAAFACLALALLARNRWIVWGWLGGAAALAAGAIATLSRASVLALAAGGLAFAVLARSGGEDGRPSQHRTIAWKKVLLVATLGAVVLAGALGAGALMERLTAADLNSEVRPSLWADAFSVVRAHPAGIGKGAFEYVYPAYENPQAIKSPAASRYGFVENGPLQLLIDTGWVGLMLVLVAAGFLIRELVRSGLGRVEAALLAGVVAVLAHNLLDFGLEMAGMAVPFAAILGTAVGRAERSLHPCWPSPGSPPESSRLCRPCRGILMPPSTTRTGRRRESSWRTKHSGPTPWTTSTSWPRLWPNRCARAMPAAAQDWRHSIGRFACAQAVPASTRRLRKPCGIWACTVRRWPSSARRSGAIHPLATGPSTSPLAIFAAREHCRRKWLRWMSAILRSRSPSPTS
jgi:hypothetical protein